MTILKPIRGTQIDRTHPLAKDLNLSFILTEGTGNKLFDLSGNAYEGTLTNMTPSIAWVGGASGHALDFAGPNSNDYVSIPSIPISGSTTIMAIITPDLVSYPDPPNDYGIAGVFVKGTFGADLEGDIRFLFIIGTALQFGVDTNVGGYVASIDVGSLAVGKKIVLAGVYDEENTVIRFYINAVQVSFTATAGTLTNNGRDLRIGAFGGNEGATEYDGLVEAAYIWNYALSPEKICQLQFDPYAMYRRQDTPPHLGGVLPGRIHLQKLLVPKHPHKYMRQNMKFHISGLDFIWRNNQLKEIGGSNRYMLINNYMILQ